jgi:hypothetical protein
MTLSQYPNNESALCIENRDSDDLEKGKVYQILQDDDAAQEGYLRINEHERNRI